MKRGRNATRCTFVDIYKQRGYFDAKFEYAVASEFTPSVDVVADSGM